MSKINFFQEMMPSLKLEDWAPASLRKHIFSETPDEIEALCSRMMDSDGEYSSLLLASRILDAYSQLDDAGQLAFFTLLNDEYDLDIGELKQAVESYADLKTPEAFKKLTQTAEPRRQELFRRLNMAPGGTRQLVKMREHLRKLSVDHSDLRRMDIDFLHLFNSWFNRGFLLMQPIDWTTPAHILEKIIAYEAVHEIGRWAELRLRLEPQDRHCFAFFHPSMEDEPLVFVEVALTESIPDKIDTVLDENRIPLDARDANCAIFYSISNCHSGLAGVSFGNFLIKQVATHLKHQFPHLKKFATLSPVPGFTKWLNTRDDEEGKLSALRDNLNSEEPDPQTLQSIRGHLAHYLINEKNNRGEPLDPVARFHLKNGACLERLNLHADHSAKGLAQSLGAMVNYTYDLSKVEENHENYMTNKQIVCNGAIRKHIAN